MNYEVRVSEVYGHCAIRTEQQAVAFLERVKMPAEFRSVALQRFAEQRGLADPKDVERRQALADASRRIREDEEDRARRERVEALGATVRAQRSSEEDDPEADDLTEDELQNLFQSERFLGRDGDNVYTLTPDNDVCVYNYSSEGGVEWKSRRVLTLAEVSSVRKTVGELRYYELCRQNDQRRRLKSL